MLTLVLSGPSSLRAQAGAILRQAGVEVERDNESSHGYPIQDGESWITAHAQTDAAKTVEHLGWTLRLHWERTGDWRNVGAVDVPDPIAELNKLKAQLRSAGINLEGK